MNEARFGGRNLRPGALVALGVLVVPLCFKPGGWSGAPSLAPRLAAASDEGCLACHAGIEDMHPAADLSCVDCHGGDGSATRKREAHVQPQREDPRDERVPDLESDPTYRRFQNPMDLRIVETTCGTCHEGQVKRLPSSLHGTTAGHLSDGYYEVGLHEDKGSVYGVFHLPAHRAHVEDGGEIDGVKQVPPFQDRLPRDLLSTHFTDLARKECMQCHLYSGGRAVRGRLGFDGDYRGQGCAACHVEYALDGMSRSSDRSIQKNEPGHPRAHSMTRSPTTEMCTSCHYGDASIGLHFRGLSQLPPGTPGGPDIPGTTDRLLNRVFYLNDSAITPPDVHHQKGMHCIDCHTAGDVMGDGMLHGNMEHAVEISCADCHGTFTRASSLSTARGTPLEHLRRTGDEVFLVSKVTGREHKVPQVVHVLDPARPEYNAKAARAMRAEHDDVECYTCHAGWNVNFLGFHFDRNESLTQLDLLSGKRTRGRVTTQEKVFATWKSFYAGLNERGRVAPYLTGFSTMGTVRDRNGDIVLDQEMPVTAAGLSGMTMIHHQLHSTRPTARSCVECHRSSATWGLGSTNFRLARQLAFVGDRRGLEVVALNRANLSASSPLSKLILPDIVDIEIDSEPQQGFARHVYVTEGFRGIHVVDVRDPTKPRRVAFVASVNPRGMRLAGTNLFLADGIGGLRAYDVSDPESIHLTGTLPMFDAHEVAIQWPYAYVADGPAGLVVVDVRDPAEMRVVGGMALNDFAGVTDAATDVAMMFQYSRPRSDPENRDALFDERVPARALCAVLDERQGFVLFDVTEPSRIRRVWPREDVRSATTRRREGVTYRGIVLESHVDRAEPQGGTRTRESDYLYLLAERTIRNGGRRTRLQVWDVSRPDLAKRVGVRDAGYATEMIRSASFYNPPLLQKTLFSPGELGVFATDATISSEPAQLGALGSIRNAYAIAVEEFPLDRMLDESDRRLKDVSHRDSRWLTLSEIGRILDVPLKATGSGAISLPGMTARLFLMERDTDGTGFLEDDEYELAGGATVDGNGDGRIVLNELTHLAGVGTGMGTVAPVPEEAAFLETRVDADGDLSRLLDGTNPFEFDRNEDDRLDLDELRRVFFAALDLDDDQRVTRDELSRHPGELRQLRYGGEWARKRFREFDANGNGALSLREFRLRDADVEAMDEDRDGYVQLPVDVDPWWESRGFVGPRSEWPTRQVQASGLPPSITVERVMEVFDRDGDGKLSGRELENRPDLFTEFEVDGDDSVSLEEVERRVGLVGRLGVEVTAEGYVRRYDLDGDGKVRGPEVPPGAEVRLGHRSR